MGGNSWHIQVACWWSVINSSLGPSQVKDHYRAEWFAVAFVVKYFPFLLSLPFPLPWIEGRMKPSTYLHSVEQNEFAVGSLCFLFLFCKCFHFKSFPISLSLCIPPHMSWINPVLPLSLGVHREEGQTATAPRPGFRLQGLGVFS